MILALLLAFQSAPLGADGPDARLDCVLGPRGTLDRDTVLTLVIGGYAVHMGTDWVGNAEQFRAAVRPDFLQRPGPASIAYHAAGGSEILVPLAHGGTVRLSIGKPSEGPGTVPLAVEIAGTSFKPLSGGCTVSTGDFASLAQGVGS